jgi:hypothetical protein
MQTGARELESIQRLMVGWEERREGGRGERRRVSLEGRERGRRECRERLEERRFRGGALRGSCLEKLEERSLKSW